ncbi:hypothetical protein NXS08_06320 [Gleimia sp. 6138-11-ORH1]|uniref:hypothetical protein n=1 Tax=Gleimia sp. 6138-11-ORH1 TaxID=2973937 RepID=UPI002169EF2C|nr:hypothetical protein [Gleimia sp. 6138-11-ORH1]MCS4485080.1 hypothetical protein [Gleimia sp. 6138-11-ORH1]
MLPLFTMLSTIEDYSPDPDKLQKELVDEATRWEYLSKRNWIEEILDIIFSPLRHLTNTAASTTSIILTIFFVTVLLTLITWIAYTWRPRKKEIVEEQEEQLIDPRIPPEKYHQWALQLRETNPDEAVKNAFRCAVATLDRAEIIVVTPGRTAGEVALLMRKNYPDLTQTINASALAFNTAAYSTLPAPRVDVNAVNTVLILADALRTRIEANATAANIIPPEIPSPQWEVNL